MPKITIVEANDWQALYVDGVMRFEDHSVPLEVLARHIPGMRVLDVTEEYDEKVLCPGGGFHPFLIDVEVK